MSLIEEIKSNINPNKELFKWGPIEFRAIYPSAFMDTILLRLTKHYSWSWPANLCLFENGRMVWLNEYLALRRAGLKYFRKYFLNLENYQKHWQKWEDWVDEYEEMAQILEKLNLKKLPDKELYRHLENLYNLSIRLWLIVHVPEIANWGGEYLLKNKLKRLFKDRMEEYLEVLSATIKFSFFQQEELDLLQLSFIKNKKEKEKALAEHAKNYRWLLNSYGGNRILKKDYFKKKLKSLLKEKKAEARIKEIKNIIKNNKRRKEQLIKKLKLDKETVLMADQLAQSIWWQDLRKGYIWRMNHYLDRFLREIAKRTDWKFPELQWLWGCELIDLVKGRKVDKEKILKRGKYFATFAKEGKMKLEEISDKKKVKQLIKIYLEEEIDKGKELKGLVVSRGKGKGVKTKGKVKIIRNPFKEGKKMKKGDILVAAMTSPEFIVVIKKAKAIITDHGGMTSHAAIVSRELKIPCIVNTKIATRALRDGDLVEVDANKGVVKILK